MTDAERLTGKVARDAGYRLCESLEQSEPCSFGSSRAFSLLLCTVGFGEVRLFLRKSRVGSGCFVYTRSENAVIAGNEVLYLIANAAGWIPGAS